MCRRGLYRPLACAVALLFPVASLAADASNVTRPPNVVRDSIPADSFFVAYLRDIDGALSQPVLQALLDGNTQTRAMLDALDAAFDGSFALAISGPPILPFLWKYTILAESTLEPEELRQRLAALGEVWNQSPFGALGAYSFHEGEADSVCVTGPVTVCLQVTRTEQLLILNDRPGFVDGLKSAPRDGFFVHKAEWTKASVGLTHDPYAFASLDLRAIVPLAAIPLTQALPNLYEALQLPGVQSATLIFGRADVREDPADLKSGRTHQASSDARTKARENDGAPQPRTTPVLRLALSVPTDAPGTWRFLAPVPVVPTLSAAFPVDTSLFIHNSMISAAALLDDVFAFQSLIDRVLVEEFNEERADFRRDLGFDPRDDFLANFVSEWAFGGRIGDNGVEQPLLAVRLADEDRFRAHLHSLRSHFDLKTSITTYRGVNIETASRVAGPFSFAVSRKTLLISTEPQAVADAVDALLDRRSLAESRAFRNARLQAPESSSRLVYVHLASVAARVRPWLDSPAARDLFTRTAEAGDLAFTVVGRDGLITADLNVNVDLGADAARVLRESFSQAREQSARQVSMVNMRSIVAGCLIYAADNHDQWPETLDVLVKNNFMPAQLFTNPYNPGHDADNKPFYLYRRVVDPKAVKDPAAEPVISEPELRGGGLCVAFVDGHVELVTGDRARQLLARMRQGR